MNCNRIGCHFLGHEDAEEFGLVMCVYCGDIAPDWAQPAGPVTLQQQIATAFATMDSAMRQVARALTDASVALSRVWPPR